jgi:uncharacterized membrane protein YeiH
VLAVPAADFYRLSISGSYRILNVNPNITTSASKFGIVAVTDAAGLFSITLPYGASETHPTSPAPQWSIALPDGRVITGVVPSVAGPLTLDDLIQTYDWVLNTSIYVAPVTPGTLARGTVTFTASDAENVVFVGFAFASANYIITLTPSVDTDTGDPPAVAWSSKTTTGFTINTSGTFTGSVDWRAEL